MSAAVHVVEHVYADEEIPLSEWARAQRCVIELFEAERMHAAALDPISYPTTQSDVEWHILLHAWRSRERL